MTFHNIIGQRGLDRFGLRRALRRTSLRLAPTCMLGAAVLAAACSSSSKSIQLTLTAPIDGQTLTVADDDKDLDIPGVQFDIAGTSKGIAQGTTINLFINDEKQAVSGKVEATNEIHIPGVTLPPGTNSIYLQTSTTSATSNKDQKYTLKALEISAPDNGATLTTKDDQDPNTDGVQIAVTVAAYGVDITQKISLLVDGNVTDSKLPDASNKATFTGVTLAFGAHKLQAQVPDGAKMIQSGEVKIDVQESCAQVSFISPALPASGTSITLGGPGSCPAKTSDPFTTRVEISTDAGDGRPVQLFVNGQATLTSKVQGASAVFDGVELTNHTGSNTLEVRVQDSQGQVCPLKFPADIFVDCAGADCTIKSPMPLSFMDTTGTTLFLNHSMTSATGNGFDFQVGTSADVIDKDVDLVIDGNSRHPFAVPAAADGTAAIAKFAGVPLSEGSHTVQAFCTDPSGNETSSDEFTWVVDTTACGVVVTDPAVSTKLVPADDTDTASDGTQVVVSSTVTGTDCSGQRAKVCDPNTGITGADFVTYDGTSPLMSTVTLDAAQTDQHLCVDVQDNAGNIGRGNVTVSFHGSAPSLRIESPADGTKYNAMGGGGYTQTADPLTTACVANVVVLCSELNVTVELWHAVTDATPLASASCAQSLGSDPPLPTGFAGRAHFDKLSFLPFTSQTGTLVATQSVTGSSNKASVGSSDIVTLQGDCQPPAIVMSPDLCSIGALGAPLPNDHVTRDIIIFDSTVDVDQMTLHVTNAGGPIDSTATLMNDSAGRAMFTSVDLGTPNGTVSPAMIEVTVTDAFANTATKSCSVNIASDLPTLTLSSPANAQPFGVAGGCNSGMAGVYGVPLSATADKTAARSAKVTVGSFVKSYGPPLGSTTLTDCVPAAEGSNTLQLDLTSTISTASVSNSVTFTVDTLSVTAPTVNQVIGQGGTCSTGMGSETGVPVSASADPVRNGLSVSIQAGSNRTVMTAVTAGAITACVPASEGSNTVTVSILDANSATIATETRAFTLITGSPTTGIPITTVTIPADGRSYRTDQVTLVWTAPTMDFAGQLLSYQLRCANTALDVGTASPSAQNTWWTQADAVTLPNGFAPPTATVALTFRIGQVRHCELRAVDALNQLTPLVNSTQVNYAFRKHLVTPPSTGQYVGWALTGVGDINGDGVDDALVGGYGEAELVFGSVSGWATSAPDVVFQGDAASSFGSAVAGIGDFNGDGKNDFAIGYPDRTNPTGSVSSAGRVFVFFGRAAGDSWPAVVDLRGAACGADLCFDTTHQDYLGYAVASAGDFNHDNAPDLAIGAIFAPDNSLHGALYVILGKAYEQGMTKPQGSKFWNISLDIHSGAATLQGFELVSDGTKAELLGAAIIGLGNFDGLPGDDLVVSAVGASATTDRIFFLSGRSYDLATATGLTSGGVNEFGFVTSGTPSGQPIDSSSTKNSFGLVLAVLGNVYDVPGGAIPGAVDIAVYDGNSQHAFIYPGDNRFAAADKFSITGAGGLGLSTANGHSAGLAQDVGDLDGDGKPELCAGTNISGTGTYPGDVALWYSNIVQTKTVGKVLSSLDSSSIGPPAGSGTQLRTVQYVGDLNGDGSPDLVVGDNGANSNQGEFTILY